MNERTLDQLDRMGTRPSAIEISDSDIVGYTKAGLAWQDVLTLEYVSSHIRRTFQSWARGPFRPFVDKGELPPKRPSKAVLGMKSERRLVHEDGVTRAERFNVPVPPIALGHGIVARLFDPYAQPHNKWIERFRAFSFWRNEDPNRQPLGNSEPIVSRSIVDALQ